MVIPKQNVHQYFDFDLRNMTVCLPCRGLNAIALCYGPARGVEPPRYTGDGI